MLHVLLPLLFGSVLLGLGYCVWWVWRRQVQVWLIPKAKIREEAEALVKLHGANADRVARDAELRACQEADIFEWGKWERIRVYLRQNVRGDNGAGPVYFQ